MMKHNETFIAVHKERGIYLGVLADRAIFSENNIPGTYAAVGFKTPADVYEFFDKHLPDLAEEIHIVSVNACIMNELYVGVTDIIKSGYTEHVASMVENIPMTNETIH